MSAFRGAEEGCQPLAGFRHWPLSFLSFSSGIHGAGRPSESPVWCLEKGVAWPWALAKCIAKTSSKPCLKRGLATQRPLRSDLAHHFVG